MMPKNLKNAQNMLYLGFDLKFTQNTFNFLTFSHEIFKISANMGLVNIFCDRFFMKALQIHEAKIQKGSGASKTNRKSAH